MNKKYYEIILIVEDDPSLSEYDEFLEQDDLLNLHPILGVQIKKQIFKELSLKDFEEKIK